MSADDVASSNSEHCMMETFQPRCWKNDVILMTSSIYGRMSRSSRCLESDPQREDQRYWGCSADVLNITDKRCSGRRECDIRLPDTEIHSSKPCGTTLNVYLEAGFECALGRYILIYNSCLCYLI